MRRKKSKALREFLSAVRRPEGLLKIDEQKYQDPPTVRQSVRAEGLRGGALVLLVATFENYLKSLFDELCADLEYKRKSNRCISLKDSFLLENNLGAIEYAIKESRLDREGKHPEVRRIAAQIYKEEIFSDGFTRTSANPGSEVVKNMLKKWGVEKSDNSIELKFQDLSSLPYSKSLIFEKLDEIISRRNEVAHTGSALNMSRIDLKSYILFMKNLGGAIDYATMNELRQKY